MCTCVSSQMKKWLVSWNLSHISPSTDDAVYMCLHWCFAHLSALLEPGHICCGSSAHESQGWYHKIQQWLSDLGYAAIHHNLMILYDHGVSVSSHYTQQVVTTSSTQLCSHWFSAQLSAVLGLGTYTDSLCTAVTMNWVMKHQLMRSAACCIINQRCSAILTATNVHWLQFLRPRPWFARNALRISARYLRCWPYRPTPTDFFLGALWPMAALWCYCDDLHLNDDYKW